MLPAVRAEAPTEGCWLSFSMPLFGSMPARCRARTRVPSAAEPTLVETFLPFRSFKEVSLEPGAVTMVLRPPRRL